MNRRPVIAGNWKMNVTAGEAESLLNQLKAELAAVGDVEIIVCPSFTTLAVACQRLAGTGINVGAQNMHWEAEGAYTGEVSGPMLSDLGCGYVILGHSERRAYFGESDGDVNKKLFVALKHKLTPIVCVGETLTEKEAGRTEAVCEQQIRGSLANLTPGDLEQIIIAYEPVWAIGTGRTATPGDAQAVIGFIRNLLRTDFGSAADKVRILYGGSVKPDNIAGLMAEADIDGGLVGGASLDPAGFAQIVKYKD
ncbi:MAG: triose-phosphate isomerase [Firmicutes bacterium]|nr:triose-phosphate isomerase [Bacillota bacterium]